MKSRLSRLIGVLLLSGVSHVAAQQASFYQQLSVGTSAVSLTGAAGASFCRGTLESAPIRVSFTGSTPTATVGQPVAIGDQVVLNNAQDIVNFRAIAATGITGVLSLSCGSGTTPAPSFVEPARVLANSTLLAVPPAVVQQSPTDLQACSPTNTTAAINNAVTLTITPPNGKYVYLCGFDLTLANNNTGAATTSLSFTSTNLGGWAWKFSQVGTANTNTVLPVQLSPRTVIKSAAPGVAVTIVSPAANAQATYSITAYYYFAS